MKDDWVPVTRGQLRASLEEQQKVNQWVFDLLEYQMEIAQWIHGKHKRPKYPKSPWDVPEDRTDLNEHFENPEEPESGIKENK